MATYPNNYRTAVGFLTNYTLMGVPGLYFYNSECGTGAGSRNNRFVGDAPIPQTSSTPQGYGISTPFPAIKAGEVASTSSATVKVSASAAATAGVPITGSATLSLTVADLEGQLISAGAGNANMAFSAQAVLRAALEAAGSTTISFSSDSLLGAIVQGTGSAAVSIYAAPSSMRPLNDSNPARTAAASILLSVSDSRMQPLNDSSPLRLGSAAVLFAGTLDPYAVGNLVGSTTDSGELSAESIASAVWEAVAAEYVSGGSMGSRLNTASAGGVDLVALAKAVRAELAVELARLDIGVGTRASQADVFAA